ncbi:hypothetical protein CLOP_g19739 [Closterium sp. NIES-67]|nr:hypothetical protein CLOP_g19739 [Closterium sp. NIES-67]
MRRTSLFCVLLCGTLFTVYGGASATSSFLAPLLPLDGGAAASAASSTAQARPLLRKGKTILKYVARFFPTKRNGKVIGDKGASGRFVAKAIRYSEVVYAIIAKILVLNIKSGGETPMFGGSSSCLTDTSGPEDLNFLNITSDRAGRRKRYSFRYLYKGAGGVDAEVRMLVRAIFGSKKYVAVIHSSNMYALCGKVKRVV